MSDTTNQQQAAKPKTLIGKAISLPFAILGILIGSLLLSVIVECLGVYFLWPELGWHHAEQMFNNELEQLSSTFKQSLLMSQPVQTTDKLLSYAYQWVFVKSGLLDQANAVLTPHITDSARKLTFRQYLNGAVNQMQTYLLAAAYTTLTFLVRLFVLILSMPLVFLAVFVGFVDGLVKRDIRRFMAGHESGFVYHRARAFIVPTLALPWVIYLALPISLPPLMIILPCAVLSGIVTDIAAASFKKYL